MPQTVSPAPAHTTHVLCGHWLSERFSCWQHLCFTSRNMGVGFRVQSGSKGFVMAVAWKPSCTPVLHSSGAWLFTVVLLMRVRCSYRVRVLAPTATTATLQFLSTPHTPAVAIACSNKGLGLFCCCYCLPVLLLHPKKTPSS